MGFVEAVTPLDRPRLVMLTLGGLAALATATAIWVHIAHTQPRVASLADEDHVDRVTRVLQRAQSTTTRSAQLLEVVS